MEQTTEMARQTLPRTTYFKELIDLLFVQPYVKIEHLVSHGVAERSYKAWKETIYINLPLMELPNRAEWFDMTTTSGGVWSAQRIEGSRGRTSRIFARTPTRPRRALCTGHVNPIHYQSERYAKGNATVSKDRM